MKRLEESNTAMCQAYEEKLALAAAASKAAEDAMEKLKEEIASTPQGNN